MEREKYQTSRNRCMYSQGTRLPALLCFYSKLSQHFCHGGRWVFQVIFTESVLSCLYLLANWCLLPNTAARLDGDCGVQWKAAGRVRYTFLSLHSWLVSNGKGSLKYISGRKEKRNKYTVTVIAADGTLLSGGRYLSDQVYPGQCLIKHQGQYQVFRLCKNRLLI